MGSEEEVPQSRVAQLTSSIFPPIHRMMGRRSSIDRSAQSDPGLTRPAAKSLTDNNKINQNKNKKKPSRSPTFPHEMTDDEGTRLPIIISSAPSVARNTPARRSSTMSEISGPNMHQAGPFLGHRKPKIFEKYKPLKLIGKGQYGTVLAVEERYHPSSHVIDERDTGKNMGRASRESTRRRRMYACKVVDIAPQGVDGSAEKQASRLNDVMNEMQMMVAPGDGGHPNVQDLVDFVVEDGKAYIVSSLCRGGDLAQALEMRGCLCEEDARSITAGILRGLAHLHSRGVAHRDIKLENVLLCDSKHDFSKIKIIDMGFAKQLTSLNEAPCAEALHTVCGTPMYIAPEMIRPTVWTGNIHVEARYGTQADMWSTGIILYCLLSGSPPFKATGDRSPIELFKDIEKAAFDFWDPVWETVSDDALDLIQCLLEPDSARRLTAAEALRHPWMSSC